MPYSLISTDELFDMMVTKINELLELEKAHNKELYEKKKEEVQLIQKVIVVRRAQFRLESSVNIDIPPTIMTKENQLFGAERIMAKLLVELHNLKVAVKHNDTIKIEEISVRKRELLKELKELYEKNS